MLARAIPSLRLLLSALGQKPTCRPVRAMSALPPHSGHSSVQVRCPFSARSGHPFSVLNQTGFPKNRTQKSQARPCLSSVMTQCACPSTPRAICDLIGSAASAVTFVDNARTSSACAVITPNCLRQ